jgi:hypothetical protein
VTPFETGLAVNLWIWEYLESQFEGIKGGVTSVNIYISQRDLKTAIDTPVIAMRVIGSVNIWRVTRNGLPLPDCCPEIIELSDPQCLEKIADYIRKYAFPQI